MDKLVQISQFLPAVKDRYYINSKGELFTDNGAKKMKDALLSDNNEDNVFYQPYIKHYMKVQEQGL